MPWVSNVTPLGMSVGEQAMLGAPLPYQVLLDRVEYLGDEGSASGYAFLPPGPGPSTVIQVLDSGNNLLDQTVLDYVATTNRFSFTLDISSLGHGMFSVAVTQGNPPSMPIGVTIPGCRASDSARWLVHGSSKQLDR